MRSRRKFNSECGQGSVTVKDNAGNGRRRAWAALIMAGVLVAVAAVAFWPEEAPPPPAAPGAKPGGGQFGPGLWTASAADSGNPAALHPPRPPAVTADGRLLVDRGLIDTFDFYLLGGLPGDRELHAGLLRNYLRSTLQGAAADQAIQYAERYLRYMREHDELLSRQSLPQWTDMPTAADAQRLLSWVEQRTRLRQAVLGTEAAQAWFGEEDVQIRRGVEEFRLPASMAASMSSGDTAAGEVAGNAGGPVEPPPPTDAAFEQRRERFLRDLADRTSKSYAALEYERRNAAGRVDKTGP